MLMASALFSGVAGVPAQSQLVPSVELQDTLSVWGRKPLDFSLMPLGESQENTDFATAVAVCKWHYFFDSGSGWGG
jgi:hypothetical protein